MYVCAMADHSSDSSDCQMVKVQNAKSSSSSSAAAAARYNVQVETSPEPDVRTSTSTLHDEELTGSYTVTSSPCNDYNVRTNLLLFN